MNLRLALAFLFLAWVASAGASPEIFIEYDATATNRVVISWEAIPGKQYNVLRTAALGEEHWQAVNATPLLASNNWVRFQDDGSEGSRFYQVVKLDSDPPEVWRLNPGNDAIGVGLQSSLKAYLRDETGIDPDSIVLSVGTDPPVTLADPRLTFEADVLTYSPADNMGATAQTVTNRLIVADTLGHRATNSWSFQLELPAVLAENAILVGAPSGGAILPAAASGLTLGSTNGDTYVYSYTGASSGLANGQVLVSADPNAPYKRRILSMTDDPLEKTVTLLTVQASLAECLEEGSVRLVGEFIQQPEAGSAQPASLGGSIPLGGTVIYDNSTLRVEVTSGQLTFDPHFTVSGSFAGRRLTAFDAEISGTVALDLTLRATAQGTGDFEDSSPLTTPRRSFRLLGLVGFVPVWVEAVLEFDIGYGAHLEAMGTATWGFESSRILTVGTKLRAGQWSHYEREDFSFRSVKPGWQMDGTANIQSYLQPKLTVYLESLVGPSLALKPYLELDGNACVQPGQAGVNLSLYAGLDGTLAVEVRGWDKDWDNLPSWELFNLRRPIWQRALTDSVGPPVQAVANMVWIPCGTFTMGSPESEPERRLSEGPQTRVTISQGFWMGRYEVTQGEYLAVMGTNPSYFSGDRSGPPYYGTDFGTDLNRPVEQVSWNDAVAYCGALTTRERNAGRLSAGYAYRLPTEAEWEYACRAGTTAAFHYGPALRSGMANFDGRYGSPPCGGAFGECYNPGGTHLERTTTVGSYAPNAWGLYDMHGNVWEWCSDWWSSRLPGGSVTDPQGPVTGFGRVIRGGGLDNNGGNCRSANRIGGYDPTFRLIGFGFRVVLAPGQP